MLSKLNTAAGLYSVAGFYIGFIVGWFVRCWKPGRGRRAKRLVWTSSKKEPAPVPAYDPNAPLPKVIPTVGFGDDGEPIIAKEEVHHPSPIPRSVAIIVIILAAMSLAFVFYTKQHENNTLQRANDRLASQVAENRALTLTLAHQQGIINANEQRLEDLVLAISTAKTPGEVSAAIQRFLRSSARAKSAEENYQQEHGGQASPSAYSPSSSPRGSPQPSSSRSASSSPGPTRSPSPSPSASPSSSSEVCVTTPAGRVCVPPVPRVIYFAFGSPERAYLD